MIGQLALLGLAIVCLLSAVYFVAKSFIGRGRIARAAYNVQRHEARRTAQINVLWGGVAFVVGIVLLLISGLSAITTGTNPFLLPTTTPTQTPIPTATLQPTITPIFVFTITPSRQGQVPVEEAEEVVATAMVTQPAIETIVTNTPIPAPTLTPTAGPVTALVTSGVGVWVRSEPSTAGAQIERALPNSLLFVLEGQETADNFTWQRVQTTSGNEGWVATEFIEIQVP